MGPDASPLVPTPIRRRHTSDAARLGPNTDRPPNTPRAPVGHTWDKFYTPVTELSGDTRARHPVIRRRKVN